MLDNYINTHVDEDRLVSTRFVCPCCRKDALLQTRFALLCKCGLRIPTGVCICFYGNSNCSTARWTTNELCKTTIIRYLDGTQEYLSRYSEHKTRFNVWRNFFNTFM